MNAPVVFISYSHDSEEHRLYLPPKIRPQVKVDFEV